MTTLARRNSSIHKVREYSLPKINLDEEYEVIHVMQEGWRGRLLLVEHKRTRHEVVLKATHKEATSKLEFFREFHYNYYLSPHPNILNAYDVAFEAGDYYIFAQEYAPFGDLTTNLTETGLGEANVKKIAPQIVSALEFMHSKELVHRNINTDNILVFNIDFSEVKLCDYGSTRKSGSLMKRKTVSLPYAAPEIVDTVQNEGFYVSTPQDVWQLGILLYILLTGALPWQKADVTDPHYLEYINWKKRRSLKTPKRFSNFTTRALRMFKRLLEPKPDKRSSVSEVYKYIDDKLLVRAMKRQETEGDNQSICYSTFSIHSSKAEKDRVLRALKEHGIETTVDRVAKRKRIHEWIEKSLTTNLMFDDNEFNNEASRQLNKMSQMFNASFRLNGFMPPQERRNSEKGIDQNNTQENNNIPTKENNYYRSQLINSPAEEAAIKRQQLNDENLIMKAFNATMKENSMNNKSSIVKSTEVKRTSSFQEKSQQQQFFPSDSPCNNYKEMHSSRSYCHNSPQRNPLSSLKQHSKSQKINSKSNGNTYANSQRENTYQKIDRSRQRRKSPEIERRTTHKTKQKIFQRSKSLARSHAPEYVEVKLQSKPFQEIENQKPTSPHVSDDSASESDDNSLCSVIPAAYYN